MIHRGLATHLNLRMRPGPTLSGQPMRLVRLREASSTAAMVQLERRPALGRAPEVESMERYKTDLQWLETRPFLGGRLSTAKWIGKFEVSAEGAEAPSA